MPRFKINNLAYIVCFWTLFSCDNAQNYDQATIIEKTDFTIESIEGNNIIGLDSLLFPYRIYFNNGKLYILDEHPSYSLSVYTIQTNEFQGRYLKKGNGPDEILFVKSLQFSEDTLIAFDNKKRRLLYFDKDSLVSKPKMLKEIKIENTEVKQPLLSNSGRIVDFSIAGTHRLNIYNFNGDLIDKVGTMPKMEGFELTKGVTYSAECQMAILDSTIVLAYLFTDMIDIYTIDGVLLKRNFGPVKVPPSTAVMDLGNGATMGSGGPDAINAFTSPRIGENFIMTLFNGRLMTDGYHTNYIYVFDAQGNPDRILELDKGIFVFTVDWENQYIYALTHDPVPAVIKFEFNL